MWRWRFSVVQIREYLLLLMLSTDEVLKKQSDQQCGAVRINVNTVIS